MAISFTCEGCGKQYTVKDDLAGKRAQCKKCNTVMKVPALPHREPDLMAETMAGPPQAGSETVAGSVQSLHGDTVNGRSTSSSRSVAGRSAAGKSVAGKSAAGQSRAGQVSADSGLAAEPEPPKDQYAYASQYKAKMATGSKPVLGGDPADLPSLESLKHVPASTEGALDYGGESMPEPRRERGPAQKNRASSEPFSFLLVVACLAALGYAGFAGTIPAVSAFGKPYDPTVVAEAGRPWAALFGPASIVAVMLFAVVGPLVLAGWAAACKIANFRTPDSIYIRSLGIAAVPIIIITVARTFPIGLDDQSIMMAALVAVPIAYALLQFVHGQKPLLAGITTGLATILGIVGVIATLSAADNAKAALAKPYQVKLEAIAVKHKADDDRRTEIARVERLKPHYTTDQLTKMDAAVKSTQQQVDAFVAGLANKRQTREKLTAGAKTLTDTIAANKAQYPDRPEWTAMAAAVDATSDQIAAFPTANPPADLAEATPPGTDWSAKPGRREVSAFDFNLTPPIDATLSLDTADGLSWQLNNAKARLTVQQINADTPSQQRPWVAPAFVIADTTSKAVAVPADNPEPTEYGTVNGLAAAKVVAPAADTTALNEETVVYTLHQGATWLKCTITPVLAGDPSLAALTQVVRSIRPRTATEVVVDPFPPADLVARYPTAKPAEADQITQMLKAKPGAEDAVIKALGISPDDAAFERLGPLLVATATEKSSRQLWRMAAGMTPLADSARNALRGLEPKTADDLAFSTLDLKPGNPPTQVKRGVDTLANADFDKARLPATSRALGNAIDAPGFIHATNGPSLEAALEKWMSEDLASKLKGMVAADTKGVVPSDCKTKDPDDRRLAMKALASTHDLKYVQTILNNLPLDPDFVSDTLIGMGSVAEGAVSTVMVDPRLDQSVMTVDRRAAVKILGEIGTGRSVPRLNQVIAMTGDDDVKSGAKEAIDKIQSWLKDAKAAGKPITTR